MPNEMLSVCCGAPEHPDVEGMCAQCLDWTGFEPEEEPDDPSPARGVAGDPNSAPAVVEGTR